MRETAYAPLFYDDLAILEELPDSSRGRVITALLRFGRYHEEPAELDLAERVCYRALVQRVTVAQEHYENRCLRNQQIAREAWRSRRSKKTGVLDEENFPLCI